MKMLPLWLMWIGGVLFVCSFFDVANVSGHIYRAVASFYTNLAEIMMEHPLAMVGVSMYVLGVSLSLFRPIKWR